VLYHLYDLQHAALTPARLTAEVTRAYYQHPWNPFSYTSTGRTIAANAELFERITRRFGKPAFLLEKTKIGNKEIKVTEKTVYCMPFCNLVHFSRATSRKDPKVLIVAPMSGHFATLLRGTVEALLPHHDVYITDWKDARQVPPRHGQFSFDTYIQYLRDFLHLLGPKTHIIAVCQPAVPVYATVALMEEANDPDTPLSMTLMGGPIDTRVSKTAVTQLAESRPLSWFERNVITRVPFYYPGAGRKVYPGFLQLTGFMSMNLDRHVGSHVKFYHHLIVGDGDSAKKHRQFYNEYLSVMDITADFYLQTVENVFQKFSLPRGIMKWKDPVSHLTLPVNPGAIKNTAILSVEGELDDISAHGQTAAVHDISSNLPASKKYHHFQENVGHYGIFNGRRWREHIMPRIRSFIRRFDENVSPIPEADLDKIPDHQPAQWNKEIHSIEAINKEKSKKIA
jgi:poly(3-hydroxybutyrate) depolymerase